MSADKKPDKESLASESPETTSRQSPYDSTVETRLGTSIGTSIDASSSGSTIVPPEVQELIDQVLPARDRRLLNQHALATGGMGKVDVVLDVGLQRRIAKKVIRLKLSDTAYAVKLFLREAQVTAQLDHPSIVPVHEVGLDDSGRLFFTMKLVDGKTFEEWVQELPGDGFDSTQLHELLDVLIKLCDALAFAHDRGVVHGDIKPPNVMVGEYGAVYLMDWGLARVVEGSTTSVSDALRTGREAAGGTPAFMSPEQAQGKVSHERTDVFGVATLAYFALTGHAPYRSEQAAEVLLAARAGNAASLDELGYQLPRELVRILSKAMSADPADRHATIAELGGELRVFLRGGAEFPRLEVKAGEPIVRQGETGDEVYLIERGRARVFQEVDGETVKLGEMGPGDVFGEMAILVSSTRTASVEAIEDCVLRVVTGEALEREVHGMKPWMAALIKTLAERLRRREA